MNVVLCDLLDHGTTTTPEGTTVPMDLDRARVVGDRWLKGWFFPTKKNAPAARFFAAHSFTGQKQNETGSLWALPVEATSVRFPAWITLLPVQKPSA